MHNELNFLEVVCNKTKRNEARCNNISKKVPSFLPLVPYQQTHYYLQNRGRFNDSKHNSITFYFVHSALNTIDIGKNQHFERQNFIIDKVFSLFRAAGVGSGWDGFFFAMLSLFVLYFLCVFMFIHSFAQSFVCSSSFCQCMSVNFTSSPPIELSHNLFYL